MDIELDVDADEFGIFDGRVIAQQLITEAIWLIAPYVNTDGEAASNLKD